MNRIKIIMPFTILLLFSSIALALPDIAVQSITVPASIQPGQSFSINFVIKNQGTSAATTGFYSKMWMDGSPYLNQWVVMSLAPGETKTFTKSGVSLSAGSHTVKVIADSNKQLTESNENNNEMTKTFPVSSVDPCASVTCNSYCDGTTWNYGGYCSGGICHYSIEPMSTNCGYDPCAFMLCQSYCDGTTWNHAGYCSSGTCHYSIEPMSANCGYDPCAFMLCESYCDGTTSYTSSGCSAGNCNYAPAYNSLSCSQAPLTCDDYCDGTTRHHDGYVSGGVCSYSAEYNSTACGYVLPIADPCSGVVCADNCTGTTLLHNGQCVSGVCQYTEEPLSESCGYDLCWNVTCKEKCIGGEYYFMPFCMQGQCYWGAHTPGAICWEDPACVGVNCVDHCNGTTREFSGRCEKGQCIYHKDANSTQCGYAAPLNCSDHCVGTTLFYSGIEFAGICVYETEVNASYCGYVAPPAPDLCYNVNCADYCDGTMLVAGGSCSNGHCVYSNLTKQSTLCGYVPSPVLAPAEVAVSAVGITPGSMSCDAAEEVLITVKLFNRGDETAEDVGIGFFSSGLQTGKSYLPFDLPGKTVINKEMKFTVPAEKIPGTYTINVFVDHDGNHMERTLKLDVARCSSNDVPEYYFIENLDDMPDVYQYGYSYALGAGKDTSCGPSSTTNSMIWNYNRGFTNLSSGSGIEAVNITLWELAGPDYMNTYTGGATDPVSLVRNIVTFVDAKGYAAENVWFQGWKNMDDEYDTNVTVPELDWIKKALSEGSNVLLHVAWYDYTNITDNYRRLHGHWVTMVGYGKTENGILDPNYIVIHDPATPVSDGREEYVNMSMIMSGTMSGNSLMPDSANGTYIMYGVRLWNETNILKDADYVLLEGAVRFDIVERDGPGTQQAQASLSSSGSSGGGGGGSSSRTSLSAPVTITAPAPAVNPALQFVGAVGSYGASSSGVQESGSEGETVFVRDDELTVGTSGAEPGGDTSETGDSEPDASEQVQDSGEPGKVIRVQMACVDGKCGPAADWNEDCSDDQPCRSGLDCKSTAKWWNVFSWDDGVCCTEKDPLMDDSCAILISS